MLTPTKRKKIPQSVILRLANARCKHCPETNNLTVNHITPLALGGSNDISNLEIVCLQHQRRFHGTASKKSDWR